MNKYNEGDLVEATNGETKIVGRVAKYAGIVLGIEDSGWPLDNLEKDGFTLKLIERATSPLPTRLGAYLDVDFRVWILDQDGWHGVTDDPPEDYTPFTRLVPEATA